MGIRLCPKCSGKVSSSRNVCIHCGYIFPSSKICPDCGESVGENAFECPVCGYIFNKVKNTYKDVNTDPESVGENSPESAAKETAIPVFVEEETPKANTQTEPQAKPQAEPQIDTQIENRIDPQIEHKDEQEVESKTDNSGDAASGDIGNAVLGVAGTALGAAEQQAEPQINTQIVENWFDPQAKPQAEPQINMQIVENWFEPQAKPQAEPQIDTQIENRIEPQAKPQIEHKAEPRIEHRVEPQKQVGDEKTAKKPLVECPYCGSTEPLQIGIDYYMCGTCKGRFLNANDSGKQHSPAMSTAAGAVFAASTESTNKNSDESVNNDTVKIPKASINTDKHETNGTVAPPIINNFANNTTNTSQEFETITFGSYEQNSDIKEPIEWLILDKKDGKALVISKYGLDCIQYNDSFKNTSWETCLLREWLNDDFYNTAFSDTEKTKIQTTSVNNENNVECCASGGNDTEDKLFLLSVLESETYLMSNEARKCSPTLYAKEFGAYEKNNFSVWWLRSPGQKRRYAAFVDTDGSIQYGGDGVDDDSVSVRPAMWLTLD